MKYNMKGGNSLVSYVRNRVINRLYPIGTVNGYSPNIRGYLLEKNHDIIFDLTNYIAPRYKEEYNLVTGEKSNDNFSQLLSAAFTEMKIDSKSLYEIDKQELEDWTMRTAIEKSRKGKR